LTRVGASVAVTGKRSAFAAYIDHLALRKQAVEILREPDWPVITQTFFCSSLYESAHNVPRKLAGCCRNRQILRKAL